MKSIILVALTLLLLAGTASASTVSINPDKTLTINGKNTFPIGMAVICGQYWDDLYGLDSCPTSFDKLNNFTLALQLVNYNSPIELQYINESSSRDVYWTADEGLASSSFNTNYHNDYFLGYTQMPEEPTTIPQLDVIVGNYNQIKAVDTDHPVFLPTFEYSLGGGRYAYEGADILMYDEYMNKVSCSKTLQYWYNSCTQRAYYFDEYILGVEYYTYIKFGNNLSNLPVPVMLHMMAIGAEDSAFKFVSPSQMRAEAYWGITAGFAGLSWWGNKIWQHSPPDQDGLTVNDTRAAYYNNFAGELNSDEIQEVLLTPTVNQSWTSRMSWDNKVVFSNNPKTIIVYNDGYTRNQLSYAYKYKNSTVSYLIAVNKLNTSVSTDITVSGLGNKTINTLGIIGTGSAAPGRSLTMESDLFSDTFDPYAAHIYEITTSELPPEEEPPTSYQTYIIRGSGGNSTWANYIIEGLQ